MACYSYSTNSPILYNNNVEIVYNAGEVYSFSSIAWLCEFPVNQQLAVYTRPTSSGVETLLIENTDYTVNTTNNRIEGVAAASGQVVIRRTTASNKMLFKFIDGAKLTATQLNASLHQLLFTIQEKEFAGSTFNYNYSLSATVPAWVTATAYTTGQVVSSGGAFYLCITNHTSSTAPPNANWSLVNPSQSGFVFLGGTNPVVFNLTSLVPGNTLVWNGSQFVSGSVTSSANNLTEFQITTPSNGQILKYNSGLAKFTNQSPTVDITQSNLLFADRTFYNNGGTSSYTGNATQITLPIGKLSRFQNASGKWVLTDPPTVFHIIKDLIPNTQDPDTFFSSVKNSIDQFAANIANPIKAKLEWTLGYKVPIIADSSTSEYLNNSKVTFWDSPEELYNHVGYNLSIPPSLQWHGILNGTTIHRNSPYFYQTLQGATELTFTSKIRSYGIKAFYLSVPECRSSNLYGIPVIDPSTPSQYVSLSVIDAATLNLNLNAIGDENLTTTLNGYYRDYYLLHLRDMVFAGSRPNPVTSNPINFSDEHTKLRDSLARHKMSLMLSVDYREDSSSTQFKDISFKRLETNESTANVLWKIPKQMIYYNKAAMSLISSADSGTINTDQITSAFKKTVRFTGQSTFRGTNTNGNSTLSYDGMGARFKSEAYWNDWVENWDVDSDVDKSTFSFNEAMVDWISTGLFHDSTTLQLHQFRVNTPPLVGGSSNSGTSGTIFARHFYPWPFRPNDIRYSATGTGGYTGTLFLNIDANTIFSNSHNFVPDPVDEYVYRVVLKKTLTPFFQDAVNYDTLKSAIILEHGFDDDLNNKSSTAKATINDIFNQGKELAITKRLHTRLDKTKVKVFVKNESIETYDSESRYVITLVIQVPRLKSIGYARIFRNAYSSAISSPRDFGSTNPDVDKDLGPWGWCNFNMETWANFTGGAGWTPSISIGAADSSATSTIMDLVPVVRFNLSDGTTANNDSIVPHDLISGRNECAVKFTRLGIPGNLWIRLSVLNTDGTLGLITSTGFNTLANSES